MEKSYCSADCENCAYGKNCSCKGCRASDGCPFGVNCFIADYIKLGGQASFDAFKEKLIDEINALKVEGLPKVSELFALNGAYVNLEYPLPNGNSAKFLDDRAIYLGNQLECEFSREDPEDERCFGIVADADFILICTYGANGADPQIVVYKKR